TRGASRGRQGDREPQPGRGGSGDAPPYPQCHRRGKACCGRRRRRRQEIDLKPWDGIIPDEEQRAYTAAGFGKPTGLGKRPALLIIDVQYRTVGPTPQPVWESIKELPTSYGQVGWDAVANISRLLKVFRENDWQVLYPHVAPKESFDAGRLADKLPA